MEKLMELQKKLKNKEPSEEVQTKTFVTKKNTMPQTNQPNKTVYSSNSNTTKTVSNQEFFNFSQPQTQKAVPSTTKPKQTTVDSNSFWGSVPTSKPPSQVKKDDDFADFFGSTTKGS